MTVSNNGENQVLDEIFNSAGGTFPAANAYISLHTADPGETGANEVTGGTYARVQVDFTAASGGALSNVALADFTGLPTTTVVGWAAWDASSGGNCFWTGWLSTYSVLGLCRAGDLSANDVQSDVHGLAADDRVVFEAWEDATVPAGITAGTLYFVIATGLTTDAFRVSTTSGGSAVDVTAHGSAVVRRVVPVPVTGGEVFRFNASALQAVLD